MNHPENICTQGNIDYLNGENPLHNKILRVADRCVRLGLLWPFEATVRQLVAVIVVKGVQDERLDERPSLRSLAI